MVPRRLRPTPTPRRANRGIRGPLPRRARTSPRPNTLLPFGEDPGSRPGDPADPAIEAEPAGGGEDPATDVEPPAAPARSAAWVEDAPEAAMPHTEAVEPSGDPGPPTTRPAPDLPPPAPIRDEAAGSEWTAEAPSERPADEPVPDRGASASTDERATAEPTEDEGVAAEPETGSAPAPLGLPPRAGRTERNVEEGWKDAGAPHGQRPSPTPLPEAAREAPAAVGGARPSGSEHDTDGDVLALDRPAPAPIGDEAPPRGAAAGHGVDPAGAAPAPVAEPEAGSDAVEEGAAAPLRPKPRLRAVPGQQRRRAGAGPQARGRARAHGSLTARSSPRTDAGTRLPPTA